MPTNGDDRSAIRTAETLPPPPVAGQIVETTDDDEADPVVLPGSLRAEIRAELRLVEMRLNKRLLTIERQLNLGLQAVSSGVESVRGEVESLRNHLHCVAHETQRQGTELEHHGEAIRTHMHLVPPSGSVP